MREIDVAAVEDLQRIEELAPEERGAPRIPGERRQRGDGRTNAGEPAVVRFDAPDGGDDPRRHAVGGANLVEQIAITRHRGAAAGNQLRGQPARDVVLE